MLLQRLKEYQSRAPDVPDEYGELPSGYKLTAVPWIVQLNKQGEQPQFIRTSGGSSRRDTGKRIPIPLLRRSGKRIKPQLLADTAEFVLGVPNPSDPERASERHKEFIALVEACASHTVDERVRAVAKFLRQLPTEGLPELPVDLQPGDNVIFEVEGVRPTDLEPVRAFWANVVPKLGQKGLPTLTKELVSSWLDQSEDEKVSKCLVCGEMKAIARVHPVPIRLPRAVSDQQVSIVTANKGAFWSYGLEQSYLAPTCRQCAEDYARAVNRLAQEEKSHILIGSVIFIFWTREEVGFNFATFMTDPKPQDVKALIESVRTGKWNPKIDDTPFYATSLSGSGGRAVVRDWLDTTVGEVKRHWVEWFQRQDIVDTYGEERRPYGIRALAFATIRKDKDLPTPQEAKALPTPTPRALLHAAFTGTPLSTDILYQAVKRSRAERRVTRPRAALIKLVLLSQQQEHKEDYMMQLDPDNPSAAYRCGRLMAVLEQAQTAAIPNINTTVVDRFYGTASSAPASVFPRLIRGAQPHLGKLKRDNAGAYYAIQSRMEEILSGLPADKAFPRILTLAEQGLFALGYYHQRAHDQAQKREAAERRRRGLPVDPATDMPLDTIEETDQNEKQKEE